MWKFHFYTLWNLERVERYLEQMAAKGFLVSKIRCFYWFQFQAVKPLNVKFFFPYTAAKDLGMIGFETQFQKTPNWRRLDGGNLLYTALYQLKEAYPVLEEAAAYRNEYLQKVFRERLRADLLCVLLLALVCCLGSLMHWETGAVWYYIIPGLLFAARAAYNGFGLSTLRKGKKK